MDSKYRTEILTFALEARVREVTEYQVNIENFRCAIERVKDDPTMSDFCKSLEGLLTTSLMECRKAQIMLDVIQSQIELE